jgi:hypothetical protein
VELNILVARHRVVPPEKVSIGYYHGLVKGFGPQPVRTSNAHVQLRREWGMGSSATKLVSRSLLFSLFLSLGYLALPVPSAAQGSHEAVILEHKVKEATRVLQQRQREAARALEQVTPRQRQDGEFATLLVKAKAQHAMIERWQKAHTGEFK